MVTPFAVTKRADGPGVSRLVVAGELDEETGAGFAVLLVNAAEQAGVSEVVVDLRRVTFLAAAGVRALLRGYDAALAADRGFLLAFSCRSATTPELAGNGMFKRQTLGNFVKTNRPMV